MVMTVRSIQRGSARRDIHRLMAGSEVCTPPLAVSSGLPASSWHGRSWPGRGLRSQGSLPREVFGTCGGIWGGNAM